MHHDVQCSNVPNCPSPRAKQTLFRSKLPI
jgi:hypothetical protein